MQNHTVSAEKIPASVVEHASNCLVGCVMVRDRVTKLCTHGQSLAKATGYQIPVVACLPYKTVLCEGCILPQVFLKRHTKYVLVEAHKHPFDGFLWEVLLYNRETDDYSTFHYNGQNKETSGLFGGDRGLDRRDGMKNYLARVSNLY